MADIEGLLRENKVVNGKSFRDAMQEVENYTEREFKVPTRAAVMARHQFNMRPKTRFQALMDQRAFAKKKAIDRKLGRI